MFGSPRRMRLRPVESGEQRWRSSLDQFEISIPAKVIIAQYCNRPLDSSTVTFPHFLRTSIAPTVVHNISALTLYRYTLTMAVTTVQMAITKSNHIQIMVRTQRNRCSGSGVESHYCTASVPFIGSQSLGIRLQQFIKK